MICTYQCTGHGEMCSPYLEAGSRRSHTLKRVIHAMKRTPVAALSLGLLWAALGCDGSPEAPPPVGGQSGDDGSEHVPPDPMLPPDPCGEEELVLDEGVAGAFGSSADELIAGLRVGASQPLFWVPFDAVANT